MDHDGGHGGHGGGHDGGHDGGGATCKMNMLFNWDTENLCIIFESWNINSPSALVFSCLFIIGLAASYELLRSQSRSYEERLIEGARKRQGGESTSHTVGGNNAEDEIPLLPSRSGAFRVSNQQQLTRALFYTAQVFLGYFLMLIFMTYNGYLIASTVVGAGTAAAGAIIAYALKPKKPKSELESKGVSIPVIPSYLPLQIDGVLNYILSVLAGKDEMELLRSLTLQLGNTVNLRGFNQDFIVLLDPSSIQHILAKNQPNYEKGPEFQAIFHEFLGSGIFNADGETWKTQRQLARPHFQTSEFRDSALINKHVDQLIKVIDRHIANTPDKPLEIQELFCRFTLDEASEFLFGEHVNSLEHGTTEFSSAFNYAQSITAWRFRVPLWKYLVPTKKYHSELRKLDEFVYRIIDNAISRQKKGAEIPEQEINGGSDEKKEGHETLLDHFLSQQAEYGFDKKYLRDMLLNFLLAGRDTTASLLSWTIWNLTQHPDVLKKLKEEIAEVVGPDTIPGYDDIKKLKYQKQVVNEVLRLCPPVPFNIRQSVHEDILPNGYYIPPGTPVTYSAYSTHRLAELWGEDALEFNPDRWGPERVGSIKPFMFVPFHAGPRICLGQNLAYTTAQVTLTRLLQHYDIQASPGFSPKQTGDIVLFSRNGVEVLISKKSLSEF
ncbi:hypothetical protein BGZ46_007204 [Entomortierella lignicola]|nr:hypothetical protein BGZ46_007204 [Entomortierella lignicola]